MYTYDTQKQELFSDRGQRLFIGIRDRVRGLLKETGAIRMGEAMRLPSGVGAADSWTMMACVDRMVELGELLEVTPSDCAGQHRVFVAVER